MPKQTATYKRCPKCQLVKLRSDFWKRSKTKSFLQSHCINCMKSASAMYKLRPIVLPDEKHCPRCESTKPRSDFYIDKGRKDGIAGFCKPCQNASQREWRLRNLTSNRESQAKYRASENGREKRSQYSRDFYLSKDGKAIQRSRKLEREYGITAAAYQARLAEQNGQCAICKTRTDGETLSVDHCHTTRKVRGLLCRKCNSAIGLLGDNPVLLKAAFEYLKQHS